MSDQIPNNDSPWRTPEEVAVIARRKTSTINKALRAGELRGRQPGGKGGKWLVHIDDVDAWIRGEDPADVQIPTVTRRRAS